MSLFNRHQHTWVNLGDYEYHPSRGFDYGGGWLSDPDRDSQIEKLMTGWTTFHQQCSGCGGVVTSEVLGKYEPNKP